MARVGLLGLMWLPVGLILFLFGFDPFSCFFGLLGLV
jgi:hypothetical protein